MWLLIFEVIQEKFPVRSHAGLLKSPPTGGWKGPFQVIVNLCYWPQFEEMDWDQNN